MLWLALYLLIAVVISFFLYLRLSERDSEDIVSCLLFGFLIGILIVIIPMIITETSAPRQWVRVETVELISLRDSKEISESFFLASGYVGVREYYFFYKKVDKGYQADKLETNKNITILEENTESGRIEVYEEKVTDPSWKPWTLSRKEAKKYKFFIPEGSIKRDFFPQ